MASPGKQAALIAKLIEDIDIAMLTTTGKGGFLMSRPLSTQQASFDGERVWFLTEADSPKVAEIRRNPKVNLAYASQRRNTYVSLAGEARVNRDKQKIHELWNDAMKAFFPKGENDPNLVLLEVQVRTVEYWDGPSSFIGKAIGFVIARVTKHEEVMGENRIVDLGGKRTTTRKPASSKTTGPGGSRAIVPAVKKAVGKAAKKATTKIAKATSASRPAAKNKPAGKKTPAKKTVAKKASRKSTSPRRTRNG